MAAQGGTGYLKQSTDFINKKLQNFIEKNNKALQFKCCAYGYFDLAINLTVVELLNQ
jgi:hypothetical protein